MSRTSAQSTQLKQTEGYAKSDSAIIEEAISSIISEAVAHFKETRKAVHYPEEDCRFFFNDEELEAFYKNFPYPDKVYHKIIKDEYGNFFAYRVARIINGKKY